MNDRRGLWVSLWAGVVVFLLVLMVLVAWNVKETADGNAKFNRSVAYQLKQMRDELGLKAKR